MLLGSALLMLFPCSDCTAEATYRLPVHVCGKHDSFVFMRYVAPTAETRPPIVLLHFTSGHSANMMPAARELARRGYPVYAFDLPGHGHTPKMPPKLEVWMSVIEQAVQHAQSRHGGQQVGLVGSSVGGDLAVSFAAWQEWKLERYGAATSVGSVVGQAIITPWQKRVSRRFALGLRVINDLDPLPVHFVMPPIVPTEWMFRIRQIYDSRELRRELKHDPLRRTYYPARVVVRVSRFKLNHPSTPVETPTLILQGTKDRLVRPRYELRVFGGLLKFYDHAELEFVNGATHGMFEECTDEAVSAIDAWFTQTLPSR